MRPIPFRPPLMLMLVLVLVLVGCGRPLSGPEVDLAQRLFGEGLDTGPVRFYRNGFIGLRRHAFATRPRTTCRERILPPSPGAVEYGRTAGVVLGAVVHVRPDVYRPDYARRAEGGMSLGQAMYLVHELTHVWQWQNRARTGYSPWRVGAEHLASADPYLFDPQDNPRFLDFSYEQQASLVEEYLCCQALDPLGARTERLRGLLAQEMTPAALPAVALWLPWDGVERGGICG